MQPTLFSPSFHCSHHSHPSSCRCLTCHLLYSPTGPPCLGRQIPGSCGPGTWSCRRGAGGGGCGDAIGGGLEEVVVVHHSNLVVLVMHNSVAVHETLDVHHTVLRLLNELLLPWHTLVGPICHLGLQAGVLVLQLLVGLGLVV